MWLLDLFGSGSGNLKTQNLKSVLPCACFHGFFSWVLGFPVTMLHTLLNSGKICEDSTNKNPPNTFCQSAQKIEYHLNIEKKPLSGVHSP